MEWFYDSSIGSGRTTRAAMKRLKEGVPWHKAGYNDKGLRLTGNGSVMRCAPIALFNYTDHENLVENSRIQSLITHPPPDCQDSAVFINVLIEKLLDREPKLEAYQAALEEIKSNEQLHARYSGIPKLQQLKLSGEVKDTVESAAYCFLATSSFEDAVVKAVNAGGDADTRGAVTGAIAGAFYGESKIPERWKGKMVDRHGRPIFEELRRIAKELYNCEVS